MAVSDTDVEFIRRAFGSFNARFQSLQAGDGIESFFAEFYAPDASIEDVGNFPTPGCFEGLAGYVEHIKESYGSYRNVDWRVESIEPIGDRVVVLARVSGKPAEDDTQLEVACGVTYEMRDGKIARSRLYVGHDRACAAARSGGERASSFSTSPSRP